MLKPFVVRGMCRGQLLLLTSEIAKENKKKQFSALCSQKQRNKNSSGRLYHSISSAPTFNNAHTHTPKLKRSAQPITVAKILVLHHLLQPCNLLNNGVNWRMLFIQFVMCVCVRCLFAYIFRAFVCVWPK